MKTVRLWLWAFAAAAFAPIIVFGANGTVILLGLVALAVPGLRAWRGAINDLARTPIGWALCGMLVIAITSLIWTPAPDVAADKLLRLVLLWFGGCAALGAISNADTNTITWLARLLPVGICVALLFYWIELATSARIISLITGLDAAMQARFPTPQEQELFRSVYGFGAISRGAGLLAIFVWPAMACCIALFPARGKWLAAVLGGAVFVTILPLPMQAASLAMVVGAGAFFCTWFAPQRGPKVMVALAVVLTVIMPLISYHVARPEVLGIEKHQLPGSWQHRVEIWHFSATKISEKPLLGWGFDASRNIDGGNTQFVLELPDGSEKIFPGIGLLPLHPHNGILQVWLEMGAVGAVLLTLLFFGLGKSLAAITNAYGRLGGAMASASTASALCVGLLSFGQWQSWWQASLWIAALLCTGALRAFSPR